MASFTKPSSLVVKQEQEESSGLQLGSRTELY